MLGKTAGGILWMFRYLERSENLARLVETGQRIALTRPDAATSEWTSVLQTSATRAGYDARHEAVDAEAVIDWLLRAPDNPSSVLSCVESARTNARLVRTALTREVWEAVNDGWMSARDALSRRVSVRDMPRVLGTIRSSSGYVRGALHGTMLRDDAYDFARLGTFLERADATARLLDVKYYVLLPSASGPGSRLDNAQWEVILRGVSGEGAFRQVHGRRGGAAEIAAFLMLDGRMPRSLAFCADKIESNLRYLEECYSARGPSQIMAADLRKRLAKTTIAGVFETGLHEFLQDFLTANVALAAQIERDYRFVE
ncbi:alpha-E domain-containing protein [Jannaschia sp. Os4]|uniref:alpha-E domain-containing protein n=1 Tax=Jannaschia sp. Os4 TaxID=2807617 RepID=UPI00193AA57B|nr:alpha-E domain-containing protein [Jannaschia sp. Os4]MBM2574884.1 alpha-E domain-containing protein [Jannaschia sp. Os4]